MADYEKEMNDYEDEQEMIDDDDFPPDEADQVDWLVKRYENLDDYY